MIDGQKLRERACRRIPLLRSQDRIAQPLVASVEELLKQGVVVEVRGAVETEPARREGRDGAFVLGLDELFGERVEVRKVEVAVQTVHREQERLLGLETESGDVAGIEKVLVRPQMNAAVAQVAHQRGSLVEALQDRVSSRGGTELAQVDLLWILRNPHGCSPYVSYESGRDEVYVQSYPSTGDRWQISTEGGTEPLWSPDGKELFYRHGRTLLAVDVITDPTFNVGIPRPLFDGNYLSTNTVGGGAEYDVSRDGTRFLMIRREPGSIPTRIHIVFNWFEELARLVPTEN